MEFALTGNLVVYAEAIRSIKAIIVQFDARQDQTLLRSAPSIHYYHVLRGDREAPTSYDISIPGQYMLFAQVKRLPKQVR